MRIPRCLRGERAASMHFVKVRGASASPMVGLCTDMSAPRRRISRMACGGGSLGCESTRLLDPLKRTNRLGEFAPGCVWL